MEEKIVDHLVIIAGQRGSGKSHFLKQPHPELDFGVDDLDILRRPDVPHMQFVGYQPGSREDAQLVIHVDLMNIVAAKAGAWKSVDEIMSFFEANPFTDWPRLQTCLSTARRVSVVTVYTDAAANFYRWADRGLAVLAEDDGDPLVDVRAVAMLGVAKLHWAFYKAWSEAVSAMSHVDHFCVDVSGSAPRVVKDSEMISALASSC